MVPGTIIGVDFGALDSTVIAILNEKGIQVIVHEPQTSSAEAIARGMLAVQAQQTGKGPGKKTGAPWFRQFEKRRRDGR